MKRLFSGLKLATGFIFIATAGNCVTYAFSATIRNLQFVDLFVGLQQLGWLLGIFAISAAFGALGFWLCLSALRNDTTDRD